MCSETSSPRLSFSSDIGQSQSQSDVLEMGCDFEFSFFTSGFTDKQQSSSADELFSHGIIIPTQPIHTLPNHNSSVIINVPSKKSLSPLSNSNNHPKRSEKPKEITSCDENKDNNNNKSQSKSFWGTFKRSSSLNCDSKRSTLLCSFPLLSRSNSTGSVPNQKRSNGIKEAMKSRSYSSTTTPQKPPLISMARSSSSSSSSSSPSSNNNNNSYAMPQKPPLKKSYGGSYGNGIRVIPVINLPPPYISKGTAKLFGLGSFLHQGKDKTTKK